jgi:hypothetical protein
LILINFAAKISKNLLIFSNILQKSWYPSWFSNSSKILSFLNNRHILQKSSDILPKFQFSRKIFSFLKNLQIFSKISKKNLNFFPKSSYSSYILQISWIIFKFFKNHDILQVPAEKSWPILPLSRYFMKIIKMAGPKYRIWSQWPKKASFNRSSQFCDEYFVSLWRFL